MTVAIALVLLIQGVVLAATVIASVLILQFQRKNLLAAIQKIEKLKSIDVASSDAKRILELEVEVQKLVLTVNTLSLGFRQ
jgi:hypothetical protein